MKGTDSRSFNGKTYSFKTDNQVGMTYGKFMESLKSEEGPGDFTMKDSGDKFRNMVGNEILEPDFYSEYANL